MNSTEPTNQQLKEMARVDVDQPFDMVNLLKYRAFASYNSANQNAVGRTGREAYGEYGKVVLPMIFQLGGTLVYRGSCKFQFVGDENQNYDELIVVRYPSIRAYLEMFDSSQYQSAIPHRKAGLEFRVLHVCVP